MLCRLAAAAPYIASVICFIGATVTLGHAAIIEEVSQDSDAASSQQKVNGSNPQGATVVTPAHSFPAFLEPRVVFEQGTPLNNYIKSLMRECEETICDIRKDEVSYDPSRITTILDNQIEYVINSFLLRKIQHPYRCIRSTLVQMSMLRDDLIENRGKSKLYKEFRAGLPIPRNSRSMPTTSLIGSGEVP